MNKKEDIIIMILIMYIENKDITISNIINEYPYNVSLKTISNSICCLKNSIFNLQKHYIEFYFDKKLKKYIFEIRK